MVKNRSLYEYLLKLDFMTNIKGYLKLIYRIVYDGVIDKFNEIKFGYADFMAEGQRYKIYEEPLVFHRNNGNIIPQDTPRLTPDFLLECGGIPVLPIELESVLEHGSQIIQAATYFGEVLSIIGETLEKNALERAIYLNLAGVVILAIHIPRRLSKKLVIYPKRKGAFITISLIDIASVLPPRSVIHIAGDFIRTYKEKVTGEDIYRYIYRFNKNWQRFLFLNLLYRFGGEKIMNTIAEDHVLKEETEKPEIILDDLDRRFIESIPPDMIRALGPRNIRHLTPEQLKYLTPEQLKYLTPEQLKYLTPEQIAQLPPEQLKYLTPEQLKYLTPEQLLNLTDEQIIQLFRKMDKKRLNRIKKRIEKI